MDEMVELRCKYCGAPLDRKDIESDSPYVTCPSCGTTQQRMDAKKYMEQMMGQIQSWISRIVPSGIMTGHMENVDPIARHNIFINSVKPSLDLELKEYRFALNTMISEPLIVLPFCKGEPAKAKHSSTQAFEFDAKLKSVAPLAVDNSSIESISGGEGVANAYALLINNSKLLGDTTPGRFAMMSNNFREASEAMGKVKNYSAVAERLNGLSDVCMASDMVLNGDALGCSAKAETAISELESAKKNLMANPRLAMTLRAIDTEIAQGRTLKNVADMVNSGASRDPLKVLNTIKDVSALKFPSNSHWDRLLSTDSRDYELFGYISDIVRSKNGGNLRICAGPGDALYPFWHVKLEYSFVTGALFSKKTLVVKEDLMVPATFTISANALGNARAGVTDIFAMAPESSIMTKLKGQEQSISGGSGIGRLVESVSDASAGPRTVIVPLSTKAEALHLAETYLSICSQTLSKLKLSRPTMGELMYVPCSTRGGLALPSAFEKLEPRVVHELGYDKLIKL